MVMTARRICTRCVMDTSDPNIVFDENGVCSHCHDYDNRVNAHIPSVVEAKRRLAELVDTIRKEGAGKPYDCIIGWDA